MELERVGIEKTAHRTLLTAAAATLSSKLAEPISATKASEVTGLLEILASHWVDYESVAIRLQSLIPVSDITNRITQEIIEFGETRNQYLLLKNEANTFLTANAPIQIPSANSSRRSSPSRGSRPRVPDLKIPTFSGRTIEWPKFWSSFSQIHRDSDMADETKLCHLQGYLTGEAARAIQSLPVLPENYQTAVHILRERFGRPDQIISHHLDSLRQLPSVHSGNDVVSLRNLYTEVDIHTRGLAEQGKDFSMYGLFLGPILFSKFPSELQLEWNSRPGSENTDLEGLIEYLKFAVQARERCPRLDRVSSSSSIEYAAVAKKRFEPKRPFIPTATGLPVASPPRSCPFCASQSHNPFNCPLGVTERKKVVHQKALCLNCLASGHRTDGCPSHFRCRVCRKAHHTAIHQDYAGASSSSRPQQQPYRHGSNGRPTQGGSSVQVTGSAGSVAQPSTISMTAPGSSLPSIGTASTSLTSFSAAEPSIASMAASQQKADQIISSKVVLLRTATVWLNTPSGDVKIRCLLDSACQRTLIRDSIPRQHRLSSSKSEVFELFGLGGSDGLRRRKGYALKIRRRGSNGLPCGDFISVYAISHESITVPVPRAPPGAWLQELVDRQLELADELEDGSGAPAIDLIVGADLHCQILYEGEILNLANGLQATNSVFGWVLLGPLDDNQLRHDRAAVAMFSSMLHPDQQLHEDLKVTWSLESLGIRPKEELQPPVEEHPIFKQFQEDSSFDGERYSVRLPRKLEYQLIPSGESLARRRLLAQLPRLKQNPERLVKYHQQFVDHLAAGFLETVPVNEIQNPSNLVHYLSHLMVERADKQTTPARIVFNGSASEPGQLSLNDVLECGPNLQEDLLRLNLEFRSHNVVVTADIQKAFLQVGLHAEDRDLVRCLWFDDPWSNDPKIVHYRYRRVIFGLKPSPFLLGATIHCHLRKYDPNSPAVQVLKYQRYVDDVVAGADNAESAFELMNEAVSICDDAGLPLGKFQTNSSILRSRLIEVVSKHMSASSTSVGQVEDNNRPKTFGFIWNLLDDTISLDVDPVLEFWESTKHIQTKRAILKTSMMLYDRMGLISPVTVAPGIIQQQCWMKGLAWDAPLPPDLANQWNQWCLGLPSLRNLKICRKVFTSPSLDEFYNLHVFCDASERGFGAVAYVLGADHSPQLLTSKARVAPLRKLTLARLELMALLIGARLTNYIVSSLSKIKFRTHIWTDSKVALAWVKTPPNQLQTWVANRVQEAQDLVPPGTFHHCPGTDNPADLCSRGSNAPDLLTSDLWWKGPPWLSTWTREFLRDSLDLNPVEEANLNKEIKPSQIAAAAILASSDFTLWAKKFSSLLRLLRVTAFIHRFIFNFRHPRNKRSGSLSSEELLAAKLWWVGRVQQESYTKELKLLKAGKRPIEPSKLVGISGALFVDPSDGLLKFSGRTLSSGEPPSPLPVLPGYHPFSILLIEDAHRILFHAWVGDTFNQLFRQFYFVPGRRAVHDTLKRCITCKRLMGKGFQQPPGPLPAVRCTPGEPFEAVGIDFAGPLFCKQDDRATRKVYICLFSCPRSRAIHLELVRDLTADRFMQALERFMSRRGSCREIYSDNALTFKRAAKDLRSRYATLRQNPMLLNFLGSKGIAWKFIPERAPWWGGFWERSVQLVKRLLRKILGQACLAEDELFTVLVKIESILNSRPLTYLYSDARDPEPLTPSTLLIGRRTNLLPPTTSFQGGSSQWSSQELRDRAGYRDHLADTFWKDWKGEHLLNLRRPLKGTSEVRQIKLGEVVIIRNEGASRQSWSLGRIVALFPSKIDGVVRAASVKTASGTLRRPVQHLFPLEVCENPPVTVMPSSQNLVPPLVTSLSSSNSTELHLPSSQPNAVSPDHANNSNPKEDIFVRSPSISFTQSSPAKVSNTECFQDVARANVSQNSSPGPLGPSCDSLRVCYPHQPASSGDTSGASSPNSSSNSEVILSSPAQFSTTSAPRATDPALKRPRGRGRQCRNSHSLRANQ